MDNAPPYVIEMLHITKEFPGIKANDDITLQLKKGEIHALLGENGAGKSTLMSVLFGLYQPEAGEIRKNGKPVKIDNPNDATALGIGMVHQHFKLIDVFTVLDNIILGAETTKLGFIQRKEARKKVEELSEKYGLKVDLDAKVEDITVGMQQRVEILKMLYRDNEILIFDEPTAVLTPQEIDELMATMKEFAREGKSILFISHKLNEIMAVADRVTVLRKGKCIGTVNTCDTNKQELSNMMVGRPVQLVIDKTPAHPGEEILHVEDLCVLSHLHKRNAVDHVSFNVRAGEIVCIAGIDGNGQSQLAQVVTGLVAPESGKMYNAEGEIALFSPQTFIDAGLGNIPEDRNAMGLIGGMSIAENLVLKKTDTDRFSIGHGAWLKSDAIHEFAEEMREKNDIRCTSVDQTARSLSGGNQQKVILARELESQPSLLVMAHPTRGLDIGAASFVHEQMIAARERGVGILLISADFDEILEMSDRILVCFEGQIMGEFSGKNPPIEEISLAMTGK